MKVEYINPFLVSTVKVIETMAMTKCVAGKPGLKQGNKTWGGITGIIGLASEKIRGNMMVSFEERAILGLVERMLSEKFAEVNKDVIDAVGEMTNMITGNAKREFGEKGISFNMALPVMIVGKDLEISQLAKGSTLTVPFSTDVGALVVEVNLAEV